MYRVGFIVAHMEHCIEHFTRRLFVNIESLHISRRRYRREEFSNVHRRPAGIRLLHYCPIASRHCIDDENSLQEEPQNVSIVEIIKAVADLKLNFPSRIN